MSTSNSDRKDIQEAEGRSMENRGSRECTQRSGNLDNGDVHL